VILFSRASDRSRGRAVEAQLAEGAGSHPGAARIESGMLGSTPDSRSARWDARGSSKPTSSGLEPGATDKFKSPNQPPNRLSRTGPKPRRPLRRILFVPVSGGSGDLAITKREMTAVGLLDAAG